MLTVDHRHLGVKHPQVDGNVISQKLLCLLTRECNSFLAISELYHEINQLMGFVPRQSLESDQPAVLRDIEDPRHIDWVEKGCV